MPLPLHIALQQHSLITSYVLSSTNLYSSCRSSIESVPAQCQSVVNDPAVHLSYQLLSLAFANEIGMEKWPYCSLMLQQRHSLSTFIYTALTDALVRK